MTHQPTEPDQAKLMQLIHEIDTGKRAFKPLGVDMTKQESLRNQVAELLAPLTNSSIIIDNITNFIEHHTAEAVRQARKEERLKARQHYASKKPLYTKSWIADFLGVSRPFLNTLLDDPDKFTVGMIRKIATLTKDRSE